MGVTGIVQKGGAEMENLETYTSVLVVLSAAILLVTGDWQRISLSGSDERRSRCDFIGAGPAS